MTPPTTPPRHPMIPGAREPNTLTRPRRGPDVVELPDAAGVPASSMDARTIFERRREGGGAANQRAARGPGEGAPKSDVLF